MKPKHIFQSIMAVGLLLLMAVQGNAADYDLSFNSETLLRAFEREDENGEDQQVVPVYEYLTVDLAASEESPFSMHVHGWGRYDLGGTDFYEETSDGELLYGYMSYRPFYSGFGLTLGRKHFYAGVVNDSVDGVGVEYGNPYFELSAFAGYPAAFDPDGRTGDSFLGGRTAIRVPLVMEVGVSYKQISNDDQVGEHLLGVDMSLDLDSTLLLSGQSVWNQETEDWQEHRYEANWTLESFLINPFYHLFYYDDYFNENETDQYPFHYLTDSEEQLTVTGGDIIWHESRQFEVGLRYKQYDYDLRSETSQYTAALLNFYSENGSVWGTEIGSMYGETSENKYVLGRAFFYWVDPMETVSGYFLSGEGIYVAYEEEIYEVDRSLFFSLGAGKEVLPDQLKIKLAAEYLSDPYYDLDVTVSMIVLYSF